MRSSFPSLISLSDDRDVYLVLNDFGGKVGNAWRETEEDLTDRETVITDLLSGEYSNPVRVVAFNTAKSWSRDVSAEIADEMAQRLATNRIELSPSIEEFINRNGSGQPVQLPLPLKGAA
jgi:hypothetical protein